ncbi:MAG: hypothetical protein PF542_00380 [Nanoarchaeota archaeon]|jgi:hypothetical protein|nr:hypothetical protein [Nanoarchaeota archaeon]
MKGNYNIIKESRSELPFRGLLTIPHQGKRLIVSSPAFGQNTFNNNVQEMNKNYTHPETRERMTFREPTTAESISVTREAYSVVKDDILKPSYQQLGRNVRTSEGVFLNPPKDKDGKPIVDEKILKGYLNKAKKIKGIWRVPNNTMEGVKDFVYAPYESFKQGEQSPKEFAVNPKTNGLARALEFSDNKSSPKLEEISKLYPFVDLWNFDSVSEPELGVSVLGDINYGELNLIGYTWVDGLVFGVKV